MTELFTVCTDPDCRCLFKAGDNLPVCPRCNGLSALTGRDNHTGEVFWTYEPPTVTYTPEVQ